MAKKSGPSRKFEIDPIQLKDMFETMSMRKIAEHFGCGETLIWMRIKELGIKRNNGKVKAPYPKRSEEHCKMLSISRRGKYGGEKAGNWRGGLAAANLSLRASGAYKQWKTESRQRVNDCCEGCGIKNGTMCDCCGYKIKLHCHHIKPFALFPEQRFDPANSEVLCPKCHNSRHNGKIG